jgi:outer membrane protein TolC
MFRFLIPLSVLLLVPPTVWAQETAPAAMTLKEVYTYALNNSERIAISQQAVRQAEALYWQALGSAFPLLSFRHQQSWEEHSDSERSQMFRLSQSGLTGYREIAAIRSGGSTIAQRRHELDRAQQLLLADLAAAFYGLMQSSQDVTSTEQLITLAEERLKELQERVRVGRTRETDSISQEFQITSLRSQLEERIRQRNARRDLLDFLTGTDVEEISLSDDPSVDIQPLEHYMGRIETRPDIRAIAENVKVAKRSTDLARANFLPDLTMTANSYTDRPAASDTIDWDVNLAVELPLWDWGARRGELNAAKAVAKQFEYTLAAARRQAELEVRNAYRDYLSAKTQLDFQTKAVELARRDHELQAKDDKQGLVTNLEVFESLDRLNTAELTLNNARLQERLSALNLELTSGSKPKEILP